MVTAEDLFAAIDAGDEAAVRSALIGQPNLASARDGDGISATLHAFYRAQPAIAEILGASLPTMDVFDAAALGRVDRLRDALDADPGAAERFTPDGFTALHYPGFFGGGDALGATQTLLDAGADVNARSRNDFDVLPLHSAVAGNRDAVVALLIEAGADVNATQRHRYTPLHGAAQNGAAGTVERLVAAGADPSLRSDDGRTPADLAEAAGHHEVAARLR